MINAKAKRSKAPNARVAAPPALPESIADQTHPGAQVVAVEEPAVQRITKVALVPRLLGREDGATLAELVTATGWLPHSTRAVLTGLRKKGHVLEKTSRHGSTCYTLATVALS
jgi:hypothetical protein